MRRTVSGTGPRPGPVRRAIFGRVSVNAEPGAEQPWSSLDAAVMRAMAHPARLALLEHLRNGGPATATECAGVVGLFADVRPVTTCARWPGRDWWKPHPGG